MHYLNHNTERVLSAMGVLAAAFWRLTTTMTQAKYGVYCVRDAITSSCLQRRTTQQSYNRQSIISDIHRHEQFWKKETGRTTPTREDGYTVMITGDQLDDLREAPCCKE